MRKTKIICTIGPASEDPATLEAMCRAGMNVARLNFSHGSEEEHLCRISRIKEIRDRLHLPVAIMLDTKGPEYRIRTFADGKVFLKEGDEFTFTTEDIVGDEHQVSVNVEGLMRDLAVGDRILLANGMLAFDIVEIDDTRAKCVVAIGGELSDRKSMAFPGKVLSQPYLSDKDREDIRFGMANGVDFIACSFVSQRQDLLDVKEFIHENGGGDIELIAKIENQPGIDNIDEICAECSGIMIGRGDLGVEIPFERLPAVQKKLITKCRLMGKRVITATEMLESMIHNPRPTRAETSDVANAVYDGSSAIMLSGETAAGRYPLKALETMAAIAEETERNIHYGKRFRNFSFENRDIVDAISHSVCGMSIDINARAIAVCTLSGRTARMVSRFRPPVDILGVTTNETSWRRLALSWGVTPVMCPQFNSTDVLFYTARQLAAATFDLHPGDNIILTGGITNGQPGNTNIIKVETI